MKKLDIKNPRFGLVNSTLKDYKEVEAVFNYNGSDYKYFIFIKEGKNVNYINEAKKQFDKDLKSGKVLKVVKGSAINPRPWLIAGAAVLGVAAITFASLFTWKMVTNNGGGSVPTETECIVTFESNGGGHVDTKKVKPGTTITAPTVSRTDYTFGGWYEKSDLSGDKFNFNTPINKDYTFYAKWTGGPTPSSYAVTVKAGEGGEFSEDVTEFTLNVVPNSKLSEDLSIIAKPTYVSDEKLSQTFDKFTYENGSEIKDSDVVTSDGVTVIGTYRNKTLEECSWKEISEISAKGAAYAEAFFGPIIENDAQGNAVRHSIEKTVMVNGQPHKVRIIGYGEDYTDLSDKEHTAIGITFEFENLISDANGNSLATQWNDTDTTAGSNYNYLKSSIRYALNRKTGEGGCDHILWAQKEAEAWSTDYKNKCVLDMLPYELVSVLKTPSKYININDGSWNEQTVEDKLFLLSPKEVGGTAGEESALTYTYYEGAEDADRIKKQVNNEAYDSTQTISYTEESGQFYTGNVTSFAGYNGSAGATGDGGYSWLRSPSTGGSSHAWSVDCDGSPGSGGSVYNRAFAIAPAFCI